jgi:AraC-like DNA-binding protein
MYKSEWFDILLIAGFGQGLFFLFMLWRKNHSNRPAVQYLTAAVGMAAFLLLGRATFHPALVKQFAEVIMLPDAILFLIGPLLYFFILSLLRQPLPSYPARWLHYLPALVHISVVNTVLGLNLAGVWNFISVDNKHLWFFCIELAGIISFSSYTIASFLAFRKYREQYYEKYAAPFLGRLLIPFFVLSCGISFFWTAGFIYSYSAMVPSYLLYLLVWFQLCLVIYFIAYQIIIYPELLQLPKLRIQPSAPVPEFSGQQVDRLHQVMLEEKPYLEPEIKLGTLAKIMDMPRHELSKLINSGIGKNFFEFINEYRVEEFIRLRRLPANNQFNTLELAYQAGFNSKSAFNRAFRKVTGKSPRAFFADQSKSGASGAHS